MNPILSIAAYKFLPLSGLKERRTQLLALCKSWNLKGSIVLSPEGINLFVAGEAEQVDRLLAELRSWPGLEDLQPKISGSEQQPFRRMLVRVKQEIIAFGVEGINPAQRTSPKLPPRELERWLDEGRPITLLDTRNDYEVKLGTFKGSLAIGIEHFRDFPEALVKLPPELKERPVVIFCTGGIRCEKAGPLMERSGFKNVSQLEGGILKYFEECGGAHYQGECFVFDQRTGLDPCLQQAQWVQCFNCRTPLSSADQQHENYQAGNSCPYCFKSPAEQMAVIITRRNQEVGRLILPLPGSQPLDHFRPLHIPAACDGLRLLDALCRVIPHISADSWAERCAQGLLLDAEDQPSSVDKVVRAGERYRHKFPALIERFTVRQFNQGDRIVVQGSPPDGLHIVALGEVDIIHNDGKEPTLVARLGPGEVVGEVALILRRPAITDVVAHHPTVTLFLQRDRFLGLARAHPKVFVELYELAVHRDQETATAASSEASETEDFVLV